MTDMLMGYMLQGGVDMIGRSVASLGFNGLVALAAAGVLAAALKFNCSLRTTLALFAVVLAGMFYLKHNAAAGLAAGDASQVAALKAGKPAGGKPAGHSPPRRSLAAYAAAAGIPTDWFMAGGGGVGGGGMPSLPPVPAVTQVHTVQPNQYARPVTQAGVHHAAAPAAAGHFVSVSRGQNVQPASGVSPAKPAEAGGMTAAAHAAASKPVSLAEAVAANAAAHAAKPPAERPEMAGTTAAGTAAKVQASGRPVALQAGRPTAGRLPRRASGSAPGRAASPGLPETVPAGGDLQAARSGHDAAARHADARHARDVKAAAGRERNRQVQMMFGGMPQDSGGFGFGGGHGMGYASGGMGHNGGPPPANPQTVVNPQHSAFGGTARGSVPPAAGYQGGVNMSNTTGGFPAGDMGQAGGMGGGFGGASGGMLGHTGDMSVPHFGQSSAGMGMPAMHGGGGMGMPAVGGMGGGFGGVSGGMGGHTGGVPQFGRHR